MTDGEDQNQEGGLRSLGSVATCNLTIHYRDENPKLFVSWTMRRKLRVFQTGDTIGAVNILVAIQPAELDSSPAIFIVSSADFSLLFASPRSPPDGCLTDALLQYVSPISFTINSEQLIYRPPLLYRTRTVPSQKLAFSSARMTPPPPFFFFLVCFSEGRNEPSSASCCLCHSGQATKS